MSYWCLSHVPNYRRNSIQCLFWQSQSSDGVYSNGSWSWVDIEQTSQWAYTTMFYSGVDDNSNLFVVQRLQLRAIMNIL